MAVCIESFWLGDSPGGVPARVQDDLCVDEAPGGDSLIQSLAKSSGSRHLPREREARFACCQRSRVTSREVASCHFHCGRWTQVDRFDMSDIPLPRKFACVGNWVESQVVRWNPLHEKKVEECQRTKCGEQEHIPKQTKISLAGEISVAASTRSTRFSTVPWQCMRMWIDSLHRISNGDRGPNRPFRRIAAIKVPLQVSRLLVENGNRG